MKSPVYVVMPTDALGGAEKRFAGLWRHLRAGGHDVSLVIRRQLFEHLSALDELQPFPQGGVEVVDDVGGDWLAPMQRRLALLHRDCPTAVFHYVMVYPMQVQRFLSSRTVYTCAASSLSLYNAKGKAGVYASVLFAARTDLLEEAVRAELSRLFPFKKSQFTATPNSFVDLEAYAPGAVQRERLVFCGLFSDEKQAFRLAETLPAVDARLRAMGVRAEYRLLGRETRQPGVAELVASFDPPLDVEARYEANPMRVLREAKVFFSLQRQSNYPSKALLEAMACGCIPIVTDVGSTRRIATDDFAFFVSRDFTPDEMATACAQAMGLSAEERARRVTRMRAFLAERFSIESMARYYVDLYESWGAP